MSHSPRVQVAIELGKSLLRELETPSFSLAMQRIKNENGWFTEDQVRLAIQNIAHEILADPALPQYVPLTDTPKKVGVIAAGNIPAVCFHDLLMVYLSGHEAYIKLSSSDTHLMLWILEQWFQLDPTANQALQIKQRLQGVDALIATGSDNTAKHFDFYFQHIPRLIRQNRTSIGILTGEETQADFRSLGQDIFQFFGLGCRNVAKVWVPKGYSFTPFFEAIEYWNSLTIHHKYFNNYSYQKSIFLVNRVPHLDNGFLLIRPESQLVSPISVLHYEEYTGHWQDAIEPYREKIQCIVLKNPESAPNWPAFDFGAAQKPGLQDFADGVNTWDFLLSV